MGNIAINIQCETVGELIGHLHKIEEDIISKGIDADEDVLLLAEFTLDDNNCYGEHTVEILQ